MERSQKYEFSLLEHTMNDPKISELTVSQLQDIIKKTVQEAIAEVLIEINAIAEAEDDLIAEAEMTEFLKASMQGVTFGQTGTAPHLDD